MLPLNNHDPLACPNLSIGLFIGNIRVEILRCCKCVFEYLDEEMCRILLWNLFTCIWPSISSNYITHHYAWVDWLKIIAWLTSRGAYTFSLAIKLIFDWQAVNHVIRAIQVCVIQSWEGSVLDFFCIAIIWVWAWNSMCQWIPKHIYHNVC